MLSPQPKESCYDLTPYAFNENLANNKAKTVSQSYLDEQKESKNQKISRTLKRKNPPESHEFNELVFFTHSNSEAPIQSAFKKNSRVKTAAISQSKLRRLNETPALQHSKNPSIYNQITLFLKRNSARLSIPYYFNYPKPQIPLFKTPLPKKAFNFNKQSANIEKFRLLNASLFDHQIKKNQTLISYKKSAKERFFKLIKKEDQNFSILLEKNIRDCEICEIQVKEYLKTEQHDYLTKILEKLRDLSENANKICETVKNIRQLIKSFSNTNIY